ncbi:hypothetical protein Ddye_014405 [Dipteronia dyeriana]|uniref:DUF4283 domain-containing protein n=1 Tax=Dipteronia dyeriana TaxID=168575 RepID=A0AAE0CKK2_9ROSI|nr:hypothetical protein Ddye_014405 [Dipteronia dyeriana]
MECTYTVGQLFPRWQPRTGRIRVQVETEIRERGLVMWASKISMKNQIDFFNMRGSMKNQIGFFHHQRGMYDRSFMEVVKEKRRNKMDTEQSDDFMSMIWEEPSGEAGWLSKCAIGVLRSFCDVYSVNNWLASRGIPFSSTYLGEKCILWSFLSESERVGFMKIRSLWDDCLFSMEIWSWSMIPQSQPMWVEISKVPLSVCNSAFLNVGKCLG